MITLTTDPPRTLGDPVDPAVLARLQQVLTYNPRTGAFAFRPGVSRPGHSTRFGKCGTPSCGGRYLEVSIDRRRYLLHRVAFALVTGHWPARKIDHENHNGRDNRWENLRDASDAFNAQNLRGPGRANTSGYLGVSWHKRYGRFVAGVTVDGRRMHLGYFEDPAAAHAAYIAAKRQHHPGNTL